MIKFLQLIGLWCAILINISAVVYLGQNYPLNFITVPLILTLILIASGSFAVGIEITTRPE